LRKISAIVVGLIVIFAMSACRTTSTGKPNPPRKQAQEYNCLKHAKDGICEVPVNGKVVLYCVKGPWKKVVRYRTECK